MDIVTRIESISLDFELKISFKMGQQTPTPIIAPYESKNPQFLTCIGLQSKVIIPLNDIAENRGQTLAQMALSWVLRDGEVTSVLIGASRASQITENTRIVEAAAFSADELAAIEAVLNS